MLVHVVKAVRFTVSGELLRQVMHMPETSRFVGASVPVGWSGYDDVEFVVSDDDIPEAVEPHETDPTCTRITAVPERIVWDWNVKP